MSTLVVSTYGSNRDGIGFALMNVKLKFRVFVLDPDAFP